MIDFKLILEIELLNKAVDAFAAQMKARLKECAKAGKRGWYTNLPSDIDVAGSMHDDADSLDSDLLGSDFDPKTDNVRTVDVANRAMILWARHNDISKPEEKKEKEHV